MLFLILLLCFGMTAMAAPSVTGDTDLSVTKDGNVSAEYTVKSDEPMESVTLTLSYDKDAVTYISGGGGNSFSGNGGNGTVQLSSKPGDTTTDFAVRFRGKKDTETSIAVTACTIVVDGQEIDVLSGESAVSDGESGEEEEEDEEHEDDGKRASFVIDERTFYLHSPEDIEDFDRIHMDIQGIDSLDSEETSATGR